MTDTATVLFTVLGVEAVRGVARLVGLANLRMEVAGIEFTIQGVQVLRMSDGKLNIRAPMFRHPRDGKFLPAIVFPPELQDAIGMEVLATLNARS